MFAYSIFDRYFDLLWTQWTKITITLNVQYFSFALGFHNNSFYLQGNNGIDQSDMIQLCPADL